MVMDGSNRKQAKACTPTLIMKRFFPRFFPSLFRHAPPVLIDLPEEYGPRMRVNEVHALFLDPRNAAMIKAMVQVLWMNRYAAQKSALDAAAMGLPTANFYLGEIDSVNNAMANIQHLMAEQLDDGTGGQMKWEPTDRMKQWFRAEDL